MIVRVCNSKKSTSSAGGGGEVSPLAPAPRIPGPDPALVTSFKYVPGGSCPMTSTYVSDRSHVGKKLDFSISPALLIKLCADSKEIDVQRSPSPQSRGRGDSSGTGSVETIIANPKYLKRTRSDLTSLDGFSDIPIYECRHEALVEENGVESRRRYGQRDAGSERDETRDGDDEDPDVVVVDDNDERRRSLMLRQRNLKSLVSSLTTRGAGPPATMSTIIVIEDSITTKLKPFKRPRGLNRRRRSLDGIASRDRRRRRTTTGKLLSLRPILVTVRATSNRRRAAGEEKHRRTSSFLILTACAHRLF